MLTLTRKPLGEHTLRTAELSGKQSTLNPTPEYHKFAALIACYAQIAHKFLNLYDRR
jgi:hypothetical protein